MVLLDRDMRFQLIHNELYYFDAADRKNIVLLLNKLLENRGRFMRREYEGDLEVRQAVHLLGFPSERDFENMVRSNMIFTIL